jgi:hypothetical protein
MKVKIFKKLGIAYIDIGSTVTQTDKGFETTLDAEGVVQLDGEIHAIRNGCVKIPKLTDGEHKLTVYLDKAYDGVILSVKDNVVKAVFNEKNAATILNAVEELKEESEKMKKQIKEIEERINGYSLF